MAAQAEVTVKSASYDPAQHPKDEGGHLSSISVRKMYKNGTVVVSESEDLEMVEVGIPAVGVAMARVATSARMCVNMGNFETVQLEVKIELPCYVEEITDAYKTAKALVDGRLNKEIADIREYRDSRDSMAKKG